MPLEKTSDWKDQAEPAMLEQLEKGLAPETLSACRADQQWLRTYRFFAEKNLVTENLDFLEEVEEFRRTGDMTLAKKIYEEYVPSRAQRQLNLSVSNRTALEEIFEDEDEPIGPPSLFEMSYEEIYKLTDTDSYKRFKKITGDVGKDLAAENGKKDEPEKYIEVGAPEEIELTRDQIQDEVVDNWNQIALKKLNKGDQAKFYEIGDLVIIDADDPAGMQPYVTWARSQQDVMNGATITMVEKGGVFDPGSIKVVGVQHAGAFEAAIKRISKKKIIY